MTACSNDDDLMVNNNYQASEKQASTRYTQGGNTVLVYMAGRNNLSRALDNDLEEIKMYSAVNIIGSY